MPDNPGKKRRRVEVRKVRAEGGAAFLNGRHRQTNPHPTCSMGRYQWFAGYDAEEDACQAIRLEEDLMEEGTCA